MALGALSSSLDQAVYKNSKCVLDIKEFPCEMLAVAAKLKHRGLFNDSLIFCLGPWTKPRFKKLMDPKLLTIAKNAHNELCAKIVGVQQDLFLAMTRNTDAVAVGMNKCLVERAANSRRDIRSGRIRIDSIVYTSIISMPGVYNTVLRDTSYPPGWREVATACTPLSENCLRFSQSARPGESGLWKDYFFCIDIADEDLPWNEAEV